MCKQTKTCRISEKLFGESKTLVSTYPIIIASYCKIELFVCFVSFCLTFFLRKHFASKR